MWQPTALAPEGPARPQADGTDSEAVVQPKLSSSSGTTSKVRSCFYPRERFTVERRKHDLVGKVQGVLSGILAQSRETGKGKGPCIPMPKGRGSLAPEW
jgi:hypothetical protein